MKTAERQAWESAFKSGVLEAAAGGREFTTRQVSDKLKEAGLKPPPSWRPNGIINGLLSRKVIMDTDRFTWGGPARGLMPRYRGAK